ncbi:MAG TPA: helix-turn-helix transcriptional regulator [Thermoanaerobaculia bacterium]|nr:helix-turn-helix transcriptional regulator [Thermoanaerobaculia bacterium]
MSKAEGARITAMLQSAIRLSNLTYRDVERELGWSVGTITRLMRGGLEFKLKHLLSILRVIHFSPARLLAVAYPYTKGDSPAEDRLQRLLENMHGEPETWERSAAPAATTRPKQTVTQEDVDSMVMVSLRKLIRGVEDRSDGAGGEPE